MGVAGEPDVGTLLVSVLCLSVLEPPLKVGSAFSSLVVSVYRSRKPFLRICSRII